MSMLRDALAGSKASPVARFSNDEINQLFWSLVWPRIKDKTITIKKWIFHFTIKIEQLKPVFVLVFGEPPSV